MNYFLVYSCHDTLQLKYYRFQKVTNSYYYPVPSTSHRLWNVLYSKMTNLYMKINITIIKIIMLVECNRIKALLTESNDVT